MKIDLGKEECELVLQGLDSIARNISSGNMAREIMESMFEPDKKDLKGEDIARYEEMMRKREQDKQLQEIKNASLKEGIEVLRAKIILLKYNKEK